jgi:hypothetical protein
LLVKENSTFGKVRQTADATVDSMFLVHASELASKKLSNSLHGSSGAVVDLDQFVSKCIYFMKSGGYRHGEENAPVIAVADDEEEDTGDGLDWALFGRHPFRVSFLDLCPSRNASEQYNEKQHSGELLSALPRDRRKSRKATSHNPRTRT